MRANNWANLFKNKINYNLYNSYKYKLDLALNNRQCLICQN